VPTNPHINTNPGGALFPAAALKTHNNNNNNNNNNNTATISPPCSPPSSPDSSSSSRSSSPSPANNAQLSAFASTQRQKVQIGKNIELELTEEELVKMDVDQISKLAGIQLTTDEKKVLKRLRRKARNKVSAAQSRQKKKDYVSGLEERVEMVSTNNSELKKQLKELEKENTLLRGQLHFFVAGKAPDAAPILSASSLPNSPNNEQPQMVPEASAMNPKNKNNNNNVTATAISSNSLASNQLRKNGKSKSGIYLMLVFLSFGIFFQLFVPEFPGLSKFSLDTPASSSSSSSSAILESSSSSSSPSSSNSVSLGRNLLWPRSTVENTIPLLDHLDNEDLIKFAAKGQPGAAADADCNDKAFWDAYYDAEYKSVDLNEKSKHEIVVWNQRPAATTNQLEFHDENLQRNGVAEQGEGEMETEIGERIRNLKLDLKIGDKVEKVVCSSVMCLLRMDDNQEKLVEQENQKLMV